MLQAENLSVTQDDKGCNLKDMPIVKPSLIIDASRAHRYLPWNHMSVIGMLNYLSGLTMPDMSFTMYQVSRFCAKPKRSHEKAAMRIARYL